MTQPNYYFVRNKTENGKVVERSYDSEKQAVKNATLLSRTISEVYSCEVFEIDGKPCMGKVTKWVDGKSVSVVDKKLQPLEPLEKTNARVKPVAKSVDSTKSGTPVIEASTENVPLRPGKQSTAEKSQSRRDREGGTVKTRRTRVEGVTNTAGIAGKDIVLKGDVKSEKKALEKANPKLKPSKIPGSKSRHPEADAPAMIEGKLKKIEGEVIPRKTREKAPAKLKKLNKAEKAELNAKMIRRPGTKTDEIISYFVERMNTRLNLADIAKDLGAKTDAETNNFISSFKIVAKKAGVPFGLDSSKIDGVATRMFFIQGETNAN